VVIVSSNFMFVSAGIALVCYALYWALILPFREWADVRRMRQMQARLDKTHRDAQRSILEMNQRRSSKLG
jgi:hypothetical protein